MGHSLICNGMECMTMGFDEKHLDFSKHNAIHPFFGTEKVVEHLKTLSDYPDILLEKNHDWGFVD